MEGTKYDNDKLRMDLIPKEAFDALAGVLGFGAKKYDDHNWRKGINHSRLYAATMRHMTSYWSGETYDPESGLNHLAHAMTNLAFILGSPNYDDRYQKETKPTTGHKSQWETGDDN